MLRRHLLRGLMATPLASWLRPWVPSAFGGAVTGGPNAAEVYRKAFGWAEALRPEQSERLREAVTIAIDDQHVGAMIQQVRPVLKAIRQAAAIDQCCWGAETVVSDDLGKGHLNVSSLNVIRIACLSARQHAKLGKCQDALDDAFAGLTLAHRIGAGGFLFARVLECAGETTAFQTLARILPELRRAALDDLSRRLAVLPPPEPASVAIGPESRFILGSLRTKLIATGPVVEGAEWAKLGFDEDEATALRTANGRRPGELTHAPRRDGPGLRRVGPPARPPSSGLPGGAR